MEFDWVDLVLAFGGSFLTWVLIRLVVRVNANKPPPEGSADAGVIRQGRWSAYAVIFMMGLVGLGMLFIAAGRMLDGHIWLAIGICSLALPCLPLAAMGFIALDPGWNVSWDETQVTGPTRLYALKPKLHQRTMHWTDIRSFGSDRKGMAYYLTDTDGISIIWSATLAGGGLLLQTAERKATAAIRVDH